MVRSENCLLDGRQVDVEEAKRLLVAARKARLPRLDFRCPECAARVDPHKAGGKVPAHFEHAERNPACSLSAPAGSAARGAKQDKSLFISTHELAKRLAGGDDYIRTLMGVVKGLALRMDLNPDAPEIIVVGRGKQIEKRAKLFLDSGASVPTYVKRGTNSWEYLGVYRATAYRTDAETIRLHRRDRDRDSVAGILFLECVDKVSVSVRGGGFADAETRKEIETAAVSFVCHALTAQGYTWFDHQRENRGYDILAKRGLQIFKIEIKGTDSAMPRFFLTRNEAGCSDDPTWRLAIVTSARSAPSMLLLTAEAARRDFSYEALAWECCLRGGSAPASDWAIG